MKPAERSQLHQDLSARREEIADDWYRAIAHTGFTSFGAPVVRLRLLDLTERAITFLCAERVDRAEARGVGKALVDLQFSHPKSLSNSQEVLACQFSAGLSANQAASLQPRLIIFLAELAGGFAGKAHEALLAQQEGVGRAFLDQHRHLTNELAVVRRRMTERQHNAQIHLVDLLHDDVLQQALGVILLAGNLRQGIDERQLLDAGNTAELTVTLDYLQEQLQVLVGQIRKLLYKMHPVGLVDLGLAAALRGVVDRLKNEAQSDAPEIALDLDEKTAKLPGALAFTLFQTAQEMLNNAWQRAKAKQIALSVEVRPNKVVLTVSDDGRGFHLPAQLSQLTRAGHYGLADMVERVDQIGGQIKLRSKPAEGTEVIVQVPLG